MLKGLQGIETIVKRVEELQKDPYNKKVNVKALKLYKKQSNLIRGDSFTKENKDKIDEFHYHEMVDRLYMMMEIIDSQLLAHPLTEEDSELKQEIEKVIDILYKQYQRIGCKEAELFKEKN